QNRRIASFNKGILLGELTRDPEVRYTPKGSAVCDLGIAVNRVYTTDSGERREEATFVDVTLWGRTAEIAGEYLKKGRPVFIEGRLQLDSWDDKQTGKKRTKLRVVGESMQLLGGRPGGAAAAETAGRFQGTATNPRGEAHRASQGGRNWQRGCRPDFQLGIDGRSFCGAQTSSRFRGHCHHAGVAIVSPVST